jgi:4-hydroxybenzoate polyprenyltransferase
MLNAPVIAAFAASTFAYAWALQDRSDLPPPHLPIAACVVVLLFFLQLRILDEFKDYDDDVRYRPYRPVPRGVVTLRALGRLGMAAAGIQAVTSALLGPPVLVVLFAVWSYAGLMAAEFFVPRWLKAHPIAYMASHMVVIPLIVAYLAASAGMGIPQSSLLWFAAMSYFSFCVFELGRKIRSPADERPGVQTYSALWGMRRAIQAWLAAMALAAVFAVLAARRIDAMALTVAAAALVMVLGGWARRSFLADPAWSPHGRVFLSISGLWLVAMFLALGTGAWLHLRSGPPA